MERQVQEEMDFHLQLQTVSIHQSRRLEKGGNLTLHGDLNGAVLLPHVVARCAPVDACAVHGQVPQSHYFWVLQICGGDKGLDSRRKPLAWVRLCFFALMVMWGFIFAHLLPTPPLQPDWMKGDLKDSSDHEVLF